MTVPPAEAIAAGFRFTEGPVWHARERALTFSDIPGDTLYRWTEAGGTAVLRRPSAQANGNTYDREGRLVSCEHATRRVTRTAADGSTETLASHYDGKRLNSPNDVVCAANGDILFTDPPYGLRQPDGSFVGEELPFRGVYRLAGSLKLLADDFELPNGLALSSDGSRLFVADTARAHIRVFDIAPDGSLRNGREFARLRNGDSVGRPDGIKLDQRGNLYVAAHVPKAIWVFNADGEFAGFIDIGEPPANLAWGGDDWRTLFVTATTSVYRLRMQVAGQPVFVP
jgi:sugar lactone lactonase YvrE